MNEVNQPDVTSPEKADATPKPTSRKFSSGMQIDLLTTAFAITSGVTTFALAAGVVKLFGKTAGWTPLQQMDETLYLVACVRLASLVVIAIYAVMRPIISVVTRRRGTASERDSRTFTVCFFSILVLLVVQFLLAGQHVPLSQGL